MTAPQTAAPSTPAPPERRLPSRLMVSLYLVIGIATLIATSLAETNTLLRYGIGIITEVGLALVALLFIRMQRLSIVATARLRVPEGEHVLLAVLAAPGLWITGVVLNVASVAILGYTAPASPSQFPSDAIEALALAVTTMVVAPVCEELMFRGYVQRGFERRSVWRGVLAGGLIFSIYHLRFQGVFALIPVALALGFIAWRTESVFPGMALHATYNTIATTLLVATDFLPLQLTGALTGGLICLGVLITPLSFVALWLLWRRTSPAVSEPRPRPKGFRRWAWAIPMVALLLVYAYAATTEVLVGRFPRLVFRTPLRLESPVAPARSERLHYTVQSVLGDPLGQATCTRDAREAATTLACSADSGGWDLTDAIPALGELPLQNLPSGLSSLRSRMRVDPQSWTLSATWDARDRQLSTFQGSRSTGDRTYQLTYDALDGVARFVSADGQSQALDLPAEDTYMPYEWAWRLQALPFDVDYGGIVTLVVVDDQGQAHAYPVLVVVEGGEPTWTTDRSYVTWKVTASWTDSSGTDHTLRAWYDTTAPHTLVRLDDGSVVYALASVETVTDATNQGVARDG